MKTQAKEILEHIKENGGYSCSDKKVIAFKKEQDKLFSRYAGKKVKIMYLQNQDWSSSCGTREGKILEAAKGWVFLPKRNRTRGKFITTGLENGHFATLTILEIEEM